MKGFTRDHKFVPMTDYKKVTRKSRDPKAKTQGVKIRKQRIVAEGRETRKHISTEFILALDNLERTLSRGRGGLKGLRYNGSMAYWSELKFRADEVSALIKKENVENEIVRAVPQDVINETLRLKRDSTERKARYAFDDSEERQVIIPEHQRGDIVMVSPENDNEGYDDFRNKKLRITDVAINRDEHRGFDEGVGQALYELETLHGEQIFSSLYDYELVSA